MALRGAKGDWGSVKRDRRFAREARRRNAMVRAVMGDGVVVMLQDAQGRWEPWAVVVMPAGRTGGAWLVK